MRSHPLLLSFCLLAAAPATAQTPAPPPGLPAVAPGAPPPASAAPAPSDTSSPDQELPPPKPLPTPTPAPPPLTWQPRQTAVLQALDKLNGEVATLTIPVGAKQDYRTLSIDVRSCYARPPDQAQDATAYLVIQDKTAAAPSFVGWLLAAEPSAAMLEHPVYDVRVLACR
jgi:hypothetical protein